MGSSTGDLLVDDEPSLDAHHRARFRAAPPSMPRTRRGSKSACASAPAGRSVLASGVARRAGGADRHAAPGAARRAARQARARAACVDRRGDGVPRRAQGLGQRRGDAASSDAGRARVLRAARHLCADEPAGARRAPSPGASGRRSRTAWWMCWAPTMPRIRARRRTMPIPDSHSGMTGVQTLVPIMLDHVNAGRLTLERFVDLTSHGPQPPVRHPRQGPHRGRLRRGFDHRRSASAARPSPTPGSNRAAAGRPTTASRCRAGRSARSCAAGASCGTAPSPGRPTASPCALRESGTDQK